MLRGLKIYFFRDKFSLQACLFEAYLIIFTSRYSLQTGKSLLFSSSDTLITNQSVDDVGEPFAYSPLELRLFGPALPAPPEMAAFSRGLEPAPSHGLIGGGFHAEIAVARALTDAFSGLFMFGGGLPVVEVKRRKTEHKSAGGHDPGVQEPLNESCVMETSMMAGAAPPAADASLMDVSLLNSSRMSLA